MASTYLTRTPTTENINKLTLSCWVKRGSLGSTQRIFSNTSSEYLFYRFESSNQFRFTIVVDGGETTIKTNRLFRDTNAWYHLVVRWDTTQSTEADRIKLYVNGVQETSFNLATYPALNSTSDMFNSGTPFEIGRYDGANNEYFDGSMSHLHCCSGYAYDASAFGETDATTGEWVGKTSPSVTYGNNGFFILKDGNGITDQSGEGNDFTLGGGTLTDLKDNPDNTFATINPLDTATGVIFNLANGNTTLNDNGSSDNDMGIKGTFGVNSGKYYWEMKKGSGSGGVHAVVSEDVDIRTGNRATNPPVTSLWGVQSNGTGSSLVSYYNGTFSSSNALQGFGANDIVGFALDMDNGKLYVSINGVFKGLDNNTSDPANGTNPAFTGIPTGDKFIFPYFEKRSSDSPETMCNFGNGYFGTTAVSSAGTNASDNGIFEYDVPTGYTALSTKGLNL